MKISRIGQVHPTSWQSENQQAGERGSKRATGSRMDQLELSAAVVDALRAKQKESTGQKGLIALLREPQKDPQVEAMKKQMKMLRQCAKIAASLREGDNVPPEDLRFLIRNNPQLYTLAMAMRKPKEDPEDCKSVLEKEDEEEPSAQKVEDGQNPPEASGGGTQPITSGAPSAPSAPVGGGGGDVSSGGGAGSGTGGGTGGGFGSGSGSGFSGAR